VSGGRAGRRRKAQRQPASRALDFDSRDRATAPGDELLILNPIEQNNYLNVRVADGEEGWVWTPNIRVFPPDSAVAPLVAGPPEVYRECPFEGDAKQAFRQAANRLKNRNTAPTPAQIDPAVTLAAMAAPGADEARWQPTQGASIVGYVIDVKAGNKETVNCVRRRCPISTPTSRSSSSQILPRSGDG
jgi:hypothetical protein